MLSIRFFRFKNSFFVLLITILFVFFVRDRLYRYSFGMAEIASSYCLYPVLKLQEKIVVPFHRYRLKRKDMHTMYQDYQALQDRYQSLQSDYIALQALHTYAQDTEELIAYKDRYAQKPIAIAHIIARQLSDQLHSFLLDVGSNDGMQVDMVVVYKNCLIGKIVEVFPQYSKVLAHTDASCHVAAMCANTKAEGVYRGTMKTNEAVLSHVTHLSIVQEGDLVLSSGHGLIFPRGFALGTIKKYKKDGLFYAIELEPVIDIERITYCYVLKK